MELQGIIDKIRVKQLEMNQEQDPTKRQKLAGDLAVLQAKRKVAELKQRNQ